MSTENLTRAMLEQLRVYIQTRDETGWYYGNKEHFERRHRALIVFIVTRKTVYDHDSGQKWLQ